VARLAGAAVAALGVLLVAAAPASATWSIVAVDPETGRVGAVLASCVPSGMLGEPDEALIPVILVPDQAAAITQGTINPDAPAGLRQLLVDGAGPDEALELLLAVDDQPTARQYGVVVIEPSRTVGSAVHSGEDVDGPLAAEAGAVATAQGLLLADEAVVDRALEAFQSTVADGRSLEQALVAGLVAGSEAGGDRRCDDDQTALFAHLAVADPGDDPRKPSLLLTVTVDEGDGQNPVPMLAEALADQRRGWIDAGLNDPAGIPRVAVLAVGALLAVAAYVVIRAGMGNTAARK
jgi:uncharacterized Ntn-hydrolase superfamily protein